MNDRIKGNCPMGCGETLFVGSGGYITCSLIGCPDPSAASRALRRDRELVFQGGANARSAGIHLRRNPLAASPDDDAYEEWARGWLGAARDRAGNPNWHAFGYDQQELRAVLERIAVTTCREWVDEKHDRCNARAEFVLWGKLIDAEGLGPRCYDHAAKHVGHRGLGDPTWAIIDLRPALKVLGMTPLKITAGDYLLPGEELVVLALARDDMRRLLTTAALENTDQDKRILDELRRTVSGGEPAGRS